MIKKCLILLISVALSLSSFAVCAAESGAYYSESELENFENSLDFYMHFGITDKKAVSSTVTRREFAKIVLAYFYGDISGTYDDAVKTMQFSGSEEDLNQNITLEEALKYMAIGLGYGATDENYISVAYGIGVAKGVVGEADMPVTFFNIIKMLDNSLEIKRVEGSITEKGSYKITDNTVLNSVFKVERKTGTVTAVPGASLTSQKALKGHVYIDGTAYETDCVCTKEILGCRVDYYADIDNSEIIKFIGASEKYNVVTVYDAEDIISYADRQYRVYTDENKEKEKKVTLDGAAYILYNGRPAKQIGAKSMIPKVGRVILTDNDNDGDAEVVSVYSFDIKIISTIDSENERVIFKDNTKVEFEDEDYFAITQNGSAEELQFKSLKAETAVLVGKNDDGGVLLEILPGSITGTVGAIDEDTITIDGKEYPIMQNAYYEQKVKNGECGTFWLDCDKRVTAIVKVNTQMTYGFMINAAAKSDIGGNVEVKLYDQNGQMRIIKTASGINLDGTKVNSAVFLNALKKGTDTVQPQLIYFSVNKKRRTAKSRYGV